MHSVLKYFILVLTLLWVICKGSNPCGCCSTGVLMGWGGRVGTWQGSSQELYKFHFSWCASAFLSAIFALGTYYELISYLLRCHFLPLRITTNPPCLVYITAYSPQPCLTSRRLIWNNSDNLGFFFPSYRITGSGSCRAARVSNTSCFFCRCWGWNKHKAPRHLCDSYHSL